MFTENAREEFLAEPAPTGPSQSQAVPCSGRERPDLDSVPPPVEPAFQGAAPGARSSAGAGACKLERWLGGQAAAAASCQVERGGRGKGAA